MGDPSICRLCMCCFLGRGEPLLQEAFPDSIRLHRLSSPPLLDFCSSTALNLASPWTLKPGYCHFLCITENGSQCLWRNARVGTKIKPSVQHRGWPCTPAAHPSGRRCAGSSGLGGAETQGHTEQSEAGKGQRCLHSPARVTPTLAPPVSSQRAGAFALSPWMSCRGHVVPAKPGLETGRWLVTGLGRVTECTLTT